MIQSINAILISSAQPERLIEYYRALEIPLKVADHGGGLHAESDFGDVHFSIRGGGQETGPSSNLSFSFYVPNLEEYCKLLKDKGIELTMEPRELPFGGVVAELVDPDGNKITLMRWQSDRN